MKTGKKDKYILWLSLPVPLRYKYYSSKYSVDTIQATTFSLSVSHLYNSHSLIQSDKREDFSSSSVFVLSHRLPLQSLTEVPLSSLLVLLLSEQTVLPDHLLLLTHLDELSCQTLLLLGLTCQTPHQLILSPFLLQSEAVCRSFNGFGLR